MIANADMELSVQESMVNTASRGRTRKYKLFTPLFENVTRIRLNTNKTLKSLYTSILALFGRGPMYVVLGILALTGFTAVVVIGTAAVSVLLIVAPVSIGFGIQIASIVFGVEYINDCPAQPCIPIYLIVFGVVNIITVVVAYCRLLFDVHTLPSRCSTYIFWSLNTFTVCWIIPGSVWLYSSVGVTECDKLLYVFTFCLIFFEYFIPIFCLCCALGACD